MDFPIKIIGIGGSASRCIRKMTDIPFVGVEYCIVSDDEMDLELNESNVRKIGLMSNCTTWEIKSYGSYMWFEQCFVNGENEENVKLFIDRSSKKVIIVAGFGGSVGSPGALWLVEICKKQNIPMTVVCTVPFSFEGKRKRQRALDAVKSLEEMGIAVKVLYAEDLWKIHEGLNLYNCFEFLDEYVADTVTDLLQNGQSFVNDKL